jgi:hypothetical protein
MRIGYRAAMVNGHKISISFLTSFPSLDPQCFGLTVFPIDEILPNIPVGFHEQTQVVFDKSKKDN